MAGAINAGESRSCCTAVRPRSDQRQVDPATAIDRVDVLVGTFAEATRPSCYGFGETLFQVFTLMATRRLQADRYYTDDFNAATYTAEGIDWIDHTTFKSVLLRNYPELKTTSLVNVQNAFYPWQ